jgi:hypothetical protein
MSNVDLPKVVATEKKTDEDNVNKRQQIAGMFQKLIKSQRDVEKLLELEAFPTLLGVKFLLHPTDSIIRKRSAACVANMTSVDNTKVHYILRQNGVIESLLKFLEAFGQYSVTNDDDEDDDDVESFLQAIQYACLALLNYVLIDTNRQYIGVHAKNATGTILKALYGYVSDKTSVQHTIKSDILYNLIIALSSLALDDSLCVEMCKTTTSDITSISVVCDVLLNRDPIFVTNELLEACTALLWNNALNESCREDVATHGGQALVNRLVDISKSNSDTKVRANASNVLQILSTTEVSQRHLLKDINKLISGLQEDDIEEVTNAAGTIWNLAKSAESRKKIQEHRGDVLLLERLKYFSEKHSLTVVYKITGALSTLTLTDSIGVNVGNLGLVDLLFDLLKSGKYIKDQMVVENILSVLNNLAVLDENRPKMRTVERVSFLTEYLVIGKHEMTEEKFSLAEKAANCLTSISVDDIGSKMIRDVGGIEKLINLVKMQELRIQERWDSDQTFNEYDMAHVRKRASTVLWNLSLDDDNLKMIEDLDGIKPLVSFLPQTELDDKIFLNNVKKREEEDAKLEASDPEPFIAEDESFDEFTYVDETVQTEYIDDDDEDQSDLEVNWFVRDVKISDDGRLSVRIEENQEQTDVKRVTVKESPVATNNKEELISEIPKPVEIKPVVLKQEIVLPPQVQVTAVVEEPKQQLQPVQEHKINPIQSPVQPERKVSFDVPQPQQPEITRRESSLAMTAKFIKQKKRWNHIRLLYESEREFSNLLAWMDVNFMAQDSHLMKHKMIDEQTHADIFQDIDCLRLVNIDFFHEMERIVEQYDDCFAENDEKILIGSIMIKRSPTLRLYKTYANNLKRAIDTLSNQLQSRNEFKQFIIQNEDNIKQRTKLLEELSGRLLFNSENNNNNNSSGSNSKTSVTPRAVPLDSLLQDVLLKKPIERVNFYTLWLEEMINVHTRFDHPDFKLLKEAHKQLSLINDYCVKKIQQLEQLEEFAKMLQEHPFSQKQKKYYLLKNVGFPEPTELQSYNVWSRKYDKLLAQSYKAWSSYKGSIDLKSSTIKTLIKKYGIVPLMRPRVWMALTGAQKKMEENQGYYQMILQSSSKSITAKVVKQIEKDVKRTYPNHPFFNDESSPVFSAMRRIFIAYSTRNPLVNYCQSFNFIVGLLLLHVSEEEAFWLFVSVIEDYLPQNFYSPNLKGVLVDASLLDELIYQNHSKLASHFKKLGFEVSTFTMAFLLKLYSADFPVETTLRIWDAMFLHGGTILFKVALALLKMNESALLKAPDLSSMLLCFQNMVVKPCFDVSALLKSASGYDKKVTPVKIEQLRKRYSTLVEAELKKQEAQRN